MSGPIEDFQNLLRSIKNQIWIEWGCEGLERIERISNTCPLCGHEHDEKPEFPHGVCFACGVSVMEWPIERARKIRERLEDESAGG